LPAVAKQLNDHRQLFTKLNNGIPEFVQIWNH